MEHPMIKLDIKLDAIVEAVPTIENGEIEEMGVKQ